MDVDASCDGHADAIIALKEAEADVTAKDADSRTSMPPNTQNTVARSVQQWMSQLKKLGQLRLLQNCEQKVDGRT